MNTLIWYQLGLGRYPSPPQFLAVCKILEMSCYYSVRCPSLNDPLPHQCIHINFVVIIITPIRFVQMQGQDAEPLLKISSKAVLPVFWHAVVNQRVWLRSRVRTGISFMFLEAV